MTGYLQDADPEVFDPQAYAKSRLPSNYSTLPSEMKKQARILATRDDPLLFAILYLPKTISDDEGHMSFGDLHFDFCRVARHLRNPINPVAPIRMAFVAPRRGGKSSWWHKIILLWVACHGHRKFFYAITSSGTQAKRWIANFKRVISQNQAIQNDFPTLCVPMKRETTGRAFSDDANLYQAESGFILGAQGADAENLGLNVDDARPDIILFDDIEPHGGSYSLHQMSQRLTGVMEGAIPMGAEGATLFFVGTVLMPGSIMDQLRKHAIKPEPKSWISDLNLKVRHYKPFVERADGTRRSFWEGAHKTEMLEEIEGSRYFATVYANEPLPENGAYWREGDIKYGTIPETEATITAIVMDPALTTKKKSDFTAIGVIRFAPGIPQFEVLYGRAFKLNPGTEVSQKIAELAGWFPEATLLIVETNAGGDYNDEHFSSIPGLHYVPIKNTKADGNKAQRAAPVLRMYQTGNVVHTDKSLTELEGELYSFPNGLHDDLPDAICFGILNLLSMYGRPVQQDSQYSYV